ncbi:MAG: tetratricopeptide repeat protein [Cyanobacteria bacterium P01_H01_bin.15]
MKVRRLFGVLLVLGLLGAPRAVVAQNVYQLFERGIAAYNAGQFSQAESIWLEVLKIEPDNADAHYRLGRALIRQNKLEESITVNSKAIQLNPDLFRVHINLGVALGRQGKLEDAIAAYRQAIQLNPDFAIAHNNLGIALRRQGKLEDAIASYRQAIQLDPDYAIPHNNLGNALRDQGKLEDAIAAYNRSIEAGNPEPEHPYSNLGYALQQQGKLEDAIANYQKALEINPTFAWAVNNLEEAQRRLALRETPTPPTFTEVLPTLQEQPFLPTLRSIVRVITATNTGFNRGTGWVIQRRDKSLLIVTNRHVVAEGEAVEVEFYSTPQQTERRLRLTAQLIHITAENQELDLAVL